MALRLVFPIPGHPQLLFRTALAIILWDRKKGIPAVILAALIAVSKIISYSSLSTDVLASLLLGSLYG